MDQSSDDNGKSRNLVPLTLLGVGVGVAGSILSSRLGADPAWLNENILAPLGTLFIRLLMMAVVPLVLASGVITVFDLAELRQLGEQRLARLNRVLPVTILAIVLGVSLANLSKPPEEVVPPRSVESPVLRAVKTVVPSNPVASIAGDQPNFLHLAFFAGLLGLAGTLISEQAAAPMLRALKALSEITLKIIDLVMRMAPVGAAGLTFIELSRPGPRLADRLAWLGVMLLAALYLVKRKRPLPNQLKDGLAEGQSEKSG